MRSITSDVRNSHIWGPYSAGHGAKKCPFLLYFVSGRSAESIALDGQLIITQPVTLTVGSLGEMDGRLVIAVDDSGTRYFKRFRRHGPIIVLESLNPDGTAPAEILSLEGEMGLPRLTGMLEVVGVLFELPN